jgi:SAM-dependent methyltransferase
LEFWHGVTLHGTQFLDPDRSRWPTSYFGHGSGIGIALDQLAPQTGRSIGVVGLGAGTLASYGRTGDRITFYEIDPAVIALARAPFTYLAQSAANITLVPGDGRLALAAQAARGGDPIFDVLVLDAFSSDAVPIHLLTAEAMDIYLRLLKPGGLIAVNFTNRLIDLRGVLTGLSRRYGMDFAFVENTPPPNEPWLYPSRWCLLTRDPELLTRLPAAPGVRKPPAEQFAPVLWTDDHSSLRDVLPQTF